MRKTKLFTSARWVEEGNSAAVNEGDVVAEFQSLAGYYRFAVETLAGSVKVLPSLDGTTFNLPQLVMSQEPTVAADAPAEQEGTLVAKTTQEVAAYFFGDFRAIRLVQVGATPARAQVLAGGDRW